MAKRESKNTSLVYSTEAGRHCPQCRRPIATCVCSQRHPTRDGDGVIRIRRETKGRGGKAVTTISGLELEPTDLKKLAKELKQTCGTGGSIKDGNVEIQGDKRDACRALLESRGHTVKFAGG
ncbi:MAG: translation initiation factor 1 [Halieaceae bacterium]|jgi:translation initiation factor 1